MIFQNIRVRGFIRVTFSGSARERERTAINSPSHYITPIGKGTKRTLRSKHTGARVIRVREVVIFSGPTEYMYLYFIFIYYTFYNKYNM